ncbi:S-layer homology domain-containing protein [Paenibacillus sp. FSL F4-0125]|uniref:S-layer homology domain-containing protein n=1 Tax=Paenibacillus sp. FSL F4-0125 TaxID=2954730 RepID=UPI0030FA600C
MKCFLPFYCYTFNDIAGLGWAQHSIQALAAREILLGIGDHTFGPQLDVTRAQFLKMLMLALELDDVNAVSTFQDVGQNDWYYSSVAAAAKLGIVQGRPDGESQLISQMHLVFRAMR